MCIYTDTHTYVYIYICVEGERERERERERTRKEKRERERDHCKDDDPVSESSEALRACQGKEPTTSTCRTPPQRRRCGGRQLPSPSRFRRSHSGNPRGSVRGMKAGMRTEDCVRLHLPQRPWRQGESRSTARNPG